MWNLCGEVSEEDYTLEFIRQGFWWLCLFFRKFYSATPGAHLI